MSNYVAAISPIGTLLCEDCTLDEYRKGVLTEANRSQWEPVDRDAIDSYRQASRDNAADWWQSWPDLAALTDGGTVLDLLAAIYCERCGLRLENL